MRSYSSTRFYLEVLEYPVGYGYGCILGPSEYGYGYGYGYILGPSPVPPIYLAGSFGLVRPAWI